MDRHALIWLPEGFSPDPYLTGIAMAQTVQGMQDAGTQACAKHYIGNEQELNRESMTKCLKSAGCC